MKRHERDAQFTAYVDARRPTLVRTAYLLCGDWHRAEDLVQQALVKLYLAWPRVTGSGTEDSYVRRVLTTTHIDDWRWRSRRPDTPVAVQDERATPTDGTDDADHEPLMAALLALPEGQRKVVVLRFWLDLSVAQTAEELGLAPGTVKSQAARGLDRLRDLLADPQLTPSDSHEGEPG